MCTCISYLSKDHYFGRNLDLEYSYNEAIVITPRGYCFNFKYTQTQDVHYAIIGVATVVDGYPLYYDAANEHGVCAAGLNFPGNAKYLDIIEGADNIAPFEFIPWVLSQSKSLSQAIALIKSVRLVDTPFSKEFPNTPLHWMISDCTGSIVVEPMNDGIKIYENPVGILTNNPPFDFHLNNLCQYMNLSREEAVNRMSDAVNLAPFSRGMGAFGLPGDLTSASRFIRAAFTKLNSVDDGSENEAVNQCFHILRSVEQQRGCVRVGGGFEKTVYSSCCNANRGIYYYSTYSNSQIHAIKLNSADLSSGQLTIYPFVWECNIKYEN